MVTSQQANELNARGMGRLHRISGHAQQVMIINECMRGSWIMGLEYL